jgi:hypothetical protein
MTITIEIAPELRAELARQAATQGVDLHTMPPDCSKAPLTFRSILAPQSLSRLRQ